MSSINETSEIPILETLESLLTDVEFVIEESTMTNLTAEDSTTDVTENNPTATSTFTTEYSTIDSTMMNLYLNISLSQIPLLER